MKTKILKVHPDDNVLVALLDPSKGEKHNNLKFFHRTGIIIKFDEQ